MAALKPQLREALLLRLVHALEDQPRATMEQLATQVGLSRATLCRYFSSREAMILEIVQEGARCTELAVERSRLQEGGAERAIMRLIQELLPIVELSMYVARQGDGQDSFNPRSDTLYLILIDQCRYWQEMGELRRDISALWLCESLFALLNKAAKSIRQGRLARQDAPRHVFAVLWGGIAHS